MKIEHPLFPGIPLTKAPGALRYDNLTPLPFMQWRQPDIHPAVAEYKRLEAEARTAKVSPQVAVRAFNAAVANTTACTGRRP